MKPKRLPQSLIAAVVVALISAGPAAAQVSARPHFVAESLTEFATAYEKRHHRVLDTGHANSRRYHAYRVVTPGSSTIVTARSVSVDASGRLHIVGEPGTVAKGQISNGAGETHILLPVTVAPPQ
jgi:hypothetical protein